MTTTPGFVHLHTHTEHSALDGLSNLKKAVQKAAADGNPALAITDHGTMGGAWRFAIEARKAGIKPIIGIEAYLALADDWRNEPDRFAPAHSEVDRESEDETGTDADEDERGKVSKKTTKTKAYQHITLLASNAEGWENLVRMVNASANSYFKKPIMDWKLIKEFGRGVIALTGCLGGPVLGPVAHGNIPEARRNLERLIDAVGKENVYVEVMEHGIDIETRALPIMAELAAEFGLPLVATNDSHYVDDADQPIHDAWLAVQTGATLDTKGRFQFHGAGYHMRTEKEMRELRMEGWWQTAVSNTVVVAARCEDVIPEPQIRVPRFDLPEDFETSKKYLISIAKGNAHKLYGNPLPQNVTERLNSELKIISDMGFIDYFLIVWDVINWARTNGIRVGPGRGSAAGSLISYCMGIVAVDPLENHLLFDRFLEPGRAGMPDIDVDFEKSRRGEVLQYLSQKYGASRVARIGSFSATKTKKALQSAAKLLGLVKIGADLSKVVPIGDGGQPYDFAQLEDATDPAAGRFREVLAEFGEPGQRVVDLARGFAGTINGESIHACGTLISDVPLTGLIPLRKDRSKANSSGLDVVTQWDGKDIDTYGMLKLDVLGLRNLDVVSKAVKFIKDTTDEEIDPDKLPHPNTKGNARVAATWELLRSGRTAGIFQMESSGMSNLAQQIKPDCLADLSAVVALFRPGPLSKNMHIMYADRKNGLQQVSYEMFTSDPAETAAIDSVLGETFGVFTYQEQMMRLGTVVSGFDAKLRSKLRKAVGKKIKSLMDEVGEALIAGAPIEKLDEVTGEIISPVFAQQTAAKLFEYMKGSADYLFNASHSFAYAQLAYVTAFLKANWPAQYGAAILATTSADDKRQAALRALREEGIVILAPDVNESGAETRPTPDGKSVILGLSEIKGVGTAGVEVAANRAAGGPFNSLRHLIERVVDENNKSLIDVGSIEGLIEAGAMDAWGTRLGLMRIARASKFHALPISGEEWGILESSTRQRTRLGVIIGQHPMDKLGEQVWDELVPGSRDEDGRKLGARVVPLTSIADIDGASTMTAAVLAEWSERAYSKGRMVNFVLESAEKSVRCVMWNETLNRLRARPDGIPTVGSIVSASARVMVNSMDVEDEEGKVIDTVITHELSVSNLERIPVIDAVAAVERVSVPSPLRRFLNVNRAPAPTPPPADEKDSDVDGSDPLRAAGPGPAQRSTSPASAGRLPIVVRDPQHSGSLVFGAHPDAASIVRRIKRGRGGRVTHLPSEPKIGTPGGVYLASEGTSPIALILWGKLDKDEVVPIDWPFDGTIPSREDILTELHHDRPADIVADLRQNDWTAGLREDDWTVGLREDEWVAGLREDEWTADLTPLDESEEEAVEEPTQQSAESGAASDWLDDLEFS